MLNSIEAPRFPSKLARLAAVAAIAGSTAGILQESQSAHAEPSAYSDTVPVSFNPTHRLVISGFASDSGANNPFLLDTKDSTIPHVKIETDGLGIKVSAGDSDDGVKEVNILVDGKKIIPDVASSSTIKNGTTGVVTYGDNVFQEKLPNGKYTVSAVMINGRGQTAQVTENITMGKIAQEAKLSISNNEKLVDYMKTHDGTNYAMLFNGNLQIFGNSLRPDAQVDELTSGVEVINSHIDPDANGAANWFVETTSPIDNDEKVSEINNLTDLFNKYKPYIDETDGGKVTHTISFNGNIAHIKSEKVIVSGAPSRQHGDTTILFDANLLINNFLFIPK